MHKFRFAEALGVYHFGALTSKMYHLRAFIQNKTARSGGFCFGGNRAEDLNPRGYEADDISAAYYKTHIIKSVIKTGAPRCARFNISVLKDF